MKYVQIHMWEPRPGTRAEVIEIGFRAMKEAVAAAEDQKPRTLSREEEYQHLENRRCGLHRAHEAQARSRVVR